MSLLETFGLSRTDTTLSRSATALRKHSYPGEHADETEEEALLSLEMTTTREVAPSGDERPIRTRTAAAQEIRYKVPFDWEDGHPVPVHGPHGPLRVPVPSDAKPGEDRSFWLGPVSYQVLVPEGAEPGALVSATGPGNVQFCATVPRGKVPGDYFEMVPSALMVQVPVGAYPGDLVEFDAPDGQSVKCVVPPGVRRGQYFAAVLDV
eukprot:CAMPEP_0194511052 /NCGR_PEP_ID=MMETSP0253-20130528/42606_1 /TAXON_ID=2966 /ORGANISM="Noctiluca scintillans" /LENGTH=206 /DNA_ID=CAMNT_0039354357 /DNA_START=9 /DNA_END=629 /DNA_ORIENTATION=-